MAKALLLLIAALLAGGTLSAPDFRVRKEIRGWKEAPGSFERFDPKKLYDIIDGGAPDYINRGLKEGVRQRMKGPGKLEAEIFAEDFGLVDSARSMFASMKAGFDILLPLPGSDTSAAFGYPSVGGLSVYAALDRFYFEVLLTGTADTALTLREAAKFLDYFSGRIEKKPKKVSPLP
jgi:hypothetical protein